MIRVLLAEDHSVVRAGLADLLGNVADFDVIGAAANGAEAVALAAERDPQVVVMDLLMPELDGIEATRQIVASDPSVNVVVLTSFSDRDRILDALDAGAIGYLFKDAEPDELFSGIRAAARGESPLAPKAAREVLLAQAHRQAPGDQREDRQGSPHERLPADRRHRPHAGGAVGGAPRRGPSARMTGPGAGPECGRRTKVLLNPGPRRGHAPGRMADPRRSLMLGRRRRTAIAGVGLAAAAMVTALAIAATGSAKGGQKLSLRASASGALKYNKKTLHAKPGTATITLTNPSGSGLRHGVEVEGKGIEKRSKIIGPGKTSRVTVTLKAGTYEFYCPVDDHKNSGMKGTIVVKK
jgi:DNA-binding NarL/FixJ family response regulator/plastocyanin